MQTNQKNSAKFILASHAQLEETRRKRSKYKQPFQALTNSHFQPLQTTIYSCQNPCKCSLFSGPLHANTTWVDSSLSQLSYLQKPRRNTIKIVPKLAANTHLKGTWNSSPVRSMVSWILRPLLLIFTPIFPLINFHISTWQGGKSLTKWKSKTSSNNPFFSTAQQQARFRLGADFVAHSSLTRCFEGLIL